MESACSTPHTSAPSSPVRSGGGGHFYSAPTSPIHFMQSYAAKTEPSSLDNSGGSFEFEFGSGSMSSADELFLNGQIRPRKFALSPLVDLETVEEEELQGDVVSRGRDLVRNKSRSIHRKTRSLSPVSSGREEIETTETTPSSSGRTNSKKWVFLKDLLYRSKSEGSNRSTPSTTREISSNKKFWSFNKTTREEKVTSFSKKEKKPVNGAAKRRGIGATSAHEVHYTARRAEKEEMKRKTYLPYKQAGLLGGCLGFSSKGYYYYGAFNGFSRWLDPVSSR